MATGSVDSEQLMRAKPGLWKRLMTEWAMVTYARGCVPTSLNPWAWEWLDVLEAAGFDAPGFTILRAGHHDRGGVIWASSLPAT
jgi:hypothetical protein